MWIIDGKINLDQTAEESNWHLATTIAKLQEQGLERRDAEDFADFAFSDHAAVRDRRPEECVTDEQWDRLTLGD